MSAIEIKGKIAAVRKTRQITGAMEMVAAGKMRRTQERMRAARPYAERMRVIIRHLARAHSESRHPLLLRREGTPRRVGLIVVSTDRGLCGGLNTYAFRRGLEAVEKWRAAGTEVSLGLVGSKGAGFFRRLGLPVVAEAAHLGDTPKVERLIGVTRVMRDAYARGDCDGLWILYNRFVSTMVQRPVLEPLLPLPPDDGDVALAHHWDYLYEPDAAQVIERLLGRYLESLLYQAVVENLACEQAARMLSMKNATDNASGLIDHLELAYNKARQAVITRELAEIVSGAQAV
ncbi:MAG: F0F1 ATP synthase subunit gamma [Magnetococcus sp. WYHC-3]